MAVVSSIELFFQEGSHDKVYNAYLVVEDDGTYSVNVEWGRRNAGFNTGKKASHVSRAEADKQLHKVIREKTGKGYQEITKDVQPAEVAPPVGQGSGAHAPAAKKKVGFAAQLLEGVEDHELAHLLDDDAFVAQQKLDGIRVLAHVEDSGIVPVNRNGERTDKVSAALLQGLESLPVGTVVDGEVMGDGSYWLFDALRMGQQDITHVGYQDRWLILADELGPGLSGNIAVLKLAMTRDDKRALYQKLVDAGAEGIVFKTRTAPYTAGRSSAQRKHKLVKSCDVVLLSNAGNAYLMGVHHGPKVHEIGKVFAGTTNESRAHIDALLAAGKKPVAEVRYLYATDDHQLFQPVFVRLRDDKAPRLCVKAQLKQTNKSVL